MVDFHIQGDSEIPASNQLFNQVRFAIASRQFPPGHKLPSTRQLALQTGLHRNTISKVYRMLEDAGLVDSQAGSGIYVRAQADEGTARVMSPLSEKYPHAHKLVKQSLDELLEQGCSLTESRELFLAEIDWRLRCSARLLVTAPTQDIGAGKLMAQELEQALQIPIQLIPMEDLSRTLDQTRCGTVVTSRYFIGEAESIAAPKSARVIPIDITNYAEEIKIVQAMPKDSCLGLVSLSSGILRASEVIIYGMRGQDILILTAQREDDFKLNSLVRRAQTIISDQASVDRVKATIESARDDLIRHPRLVTASAYIDPKSINFLKRELGLV